MKFLVRVILHILANSLAIYVADRMVPGFTFFGSWQELLLAGAILGIVNSVIRPIVKLLTLPIIFLTLGLFSVIINIALLFLVQGLVPTLQIDGFWAAFWAVIVISIVNWAVMVFARRMEKN